MGEIAVFLASNNLITTSYVIGIILLAVAVIGSVSASIQLNNNKRAILGLLGLFLIAIGLFSHFCYRSFAPSVSEKVTEEETIISQEPDQSVEPQDNLKFEPESTTQDNTSKPLPRKLTCQFGDYAPMDSFSFKSFSITLDDGEFIHGQCSQIEIDNFSLSGGVAYAFYGPGTFIWETMHGWWNICRGGEIDDAYLKIDLQAESLESHGNTETGTAQKFFCFVKNGVLSCSQ